MNATLNIGQTIGDFRIEEFVKASDENGGETYFVSGRDGKKALMKLYAVETKAHTVECGSAALLPQNLGFVPMVANGGTASLPNLRYTGPWCLYAALTASIA